MSNPKPDNLPRVIRGGGWNDTDPAWVRASNRGAITPSYRRGYIDLGFRCALRGRQPVEVET